MSLEVTLCVCMWVLFDLLGEGAGAIFSMPENAVEVWFSMRILCKTN